MKLTLRTYHYNVFRVQFLRLFQTGQYGSKLDGWQRWWIIQYNLYLKLFRFALFYLLNFIFKN